jgi:ankyrin repeat protein
MLENELENILKADDLTLLKNMLDLRPHYLDYKNENRENILAIAFDMKLSDEIISFMVNELKIDIRAKNKDGISIFDKAIINGEINWVKKFIQSGIDPNKTERVSKFTPLMEAVTYNQNAIVELLLEHGVNLNATDTSGFTAKDFAKRMRKHKILKIIETYERLGTI